MLIDALESVLGHGLHGNLFTYVVVVFIGVLCTCLCL